MCKDPVVGGADSRNREKIGGAKSIRARPCEVMGTSEQCEDLSCQAT